jgi:hypothetical protein
MLKQNVRRSSSSKRSICLQNFFSIPEIFPSGHRASKNSDAPIGQASKNADALIGRDNGGL